jgi:hypothetical protein
VRIPKDVPRDELWKLAQDALDKYPNSNVYFCFTCAYCGERCHLTDPNTLWEKGECCNCGKETVIQRGGFSLELRL